MTAHNDLPWIKCDNKRFFENASEIRVLWTHSFEGTDTQTREAAISSKNEWNLFASRCFLPWYRDGLSDIDPNSVNYSLQEYAKEHSAELERGKPMLIITAYHTLTAQCLITDGYHRAVALQSEIDRGRATPTVRVIECYGSQLNIVFRHDFTRLLFNKS